MKPCWLLTCLVLLLVSLPTAQADAQTRVLVGSSAALKPSTGDQGYAYAITRALAQRVGYTQPFEIMPWARALSIAEHDDNVLLIPTVRTPQRERSLQWIVPLLEDDYVLVSKGPVDTDPAHQPLVCVLRASAALDLAAQLGYTHLEEASDDLYNFMRLRDGHCKLWLASQHSSVLLIQHAGLKLTSFTISPSLQHLNVYLAGSANLKPEEALRWRAAFDAISADGTLAAIRRKFQID